MLKDTELLNDLDSYLDMKLDGWRRVDKLPENHAIVQTAVALQARIKAETAVEPMGKHFYTDGQRCKEGDCLKGPDHHVQTFTVVVRSNSSMVTADMLKALIESKYEVTNLGIKERRTYHPR